MDTLKRVLAVMIVILVVVVGAGLYYANTMNHGNMDMQTPGQEQTKITQPAQKPQIILEPDLRNYIDEINKGISLINEANGLVTADPFFADPPKITKEKLDTTPLDKLVPGNRPLLVLPDGTYQIIDNSGVDMRNIHRGIYKLGQGMTVLNSVLDRMNEDIKNNNFPFKSNNAQLNNSGTTNMPTNGNMTMPATGTASDSVHNMQTTGTGFTFGSVSITNILYIFLIGFLFLAIIAIFGFIASIFRPKRPDNPGTE